MNNNSPFRSWNTYERVRAAEAMVEIRDKEIVLLQRDLAVKQVQQMRRTIQLRLTATKANRTSWIDYLKSGSPRQPRAVITPYV